MSVTGKTRASRQANQAQTQTAALQSDTSLEVAQMQIDAAREAQQFGMEGTMLQIEGNNQAAGMMAGATMGAAHLSFQAAEMSLAQQQAQYDESVARLSPYAQTGLDSLPDVQEAATLDGMEARIARILETDSFQALRDERQASAEGALASAGVSRSGAAASAAADIDIGTALGLDGELYGRQMNNVAIGQSAAAGQNYAGQNFANQATAINTGTAANVGNLMMQGAGQQAGFIVQGANAAAQGQFNNGQFAQQAAYYGGQGVQGSANAMSAGMINNANSGVQFANNRTQSAIAIAGTIASFFSDERLKENMLPIGKVSDLTVYEWDWRDAMRDLIGTEMSTGYSAQEVQEKYPDCVTTIGGVLAVLYPKLNHILNEKINTTRLAA